MGAETGISWTDATFNPWWGCIKVSPGCEHCYAETWSKFTGFDIWGPAATTRRRLFSEKHWRQPFDWNRQAEAEGKRRRVFTASMADVFESHPDVREAREHLFRVIEATTWLDWQVLTKRPENVMAAIPGHWRKYPPANWWLGTSAEDQLRFYERVPYLLETPARIKFLSAEPLLGPVDIRGAPLDWVIVGGESGPKHREMDLGWLGVTIQSCDLAGVPVFVKQDSGPRPGRQGRLPDDVFGRKEMPRAWSA